MRRRLVAAMALLLVAGVPLSAQQRRTITGKVTDETSGRPISGAQIVIKGTTTGALGRADGTFAVSAPAGPVTLAISFIGYRTAEVAVAANQNNVNVELRVDVLKVDEIVVTGQATGIRRRNLANTVATVSAAELNKVPAAGIDAMLSGKMAGVQISSNSGAPGGGSRVRLRGITSIIGSGEPLYVVDGVIVSDAKIEGGMNAVSRAAGGGAIASAEQMNPQSRITDLNPDDIEKVEVLKGASASAIYGSKASNGVILITTKRGRAGQTRYQVRQGFGIAARSFTYGSRYFDTLEKAVQAFGPKAANDWKPGYTPVSLEDQLSGYKPLQYETSGSVSGGSDNTRYYASALVRHEPGIVLDTYADKASFRLNLDQNIGSKVTFAVGSELIRTKADRGMFGNDNAGTSYYFVVPHHPNFFDLRAVCPDGSRQVKCEGGVYPVNPYVQSNPLQSAEIMKRDETVWRFLGNGRLTVEAIRNDKQELRFLMNGGLDQFTHQFNLQSPPELQFEADDGLPGTRVLSYGHSLNTNLNANLVHVYKGFSGVTATTSFGSQIEREEVNLDRTASRGLIGGTENVGTATSVTVEEDNRLVEDFGFFAQEELLLLDDRLLLTLGARADKSSNNADPKEFFVYPKTAASYRIPVGGKLNELKVRAAYGESGNRPLFAQKFTNLTSTVVGGIGGLRVDPAAGASEVRPERQKEFEAGFDVQAFENRASIEFTAYQKKISDLLLQRTLAGSTGFDSEIANGGELRVRGVETTLNLTPVRGTIQWQTSLTWSANRSKVLDLPVPGFIAKGSLTQGAVRIEEGKSATQIVANDTMPGAMNATNPQVFVRTYGDGEPRWTAGWQNTFTYKRLSLGTTIDAVKGGMTNLGTWRHWDIQRNGYDEDVIDQATGKTLGDLRRRFSALAVDTYLRDASFIKLRELRLSLDLPKNITERLWGEIQSARISFAGRNLLTNQSLLGGNFYKGSDPEVANYNSGTQGANNVQWTREFAAYPSSRTFWMTFDLSF